MNKDNWDYYSTMKTATDKARAEEKTEIARKMKAHGMATEIIAEITGSQN